MTRHLAALLVVAITLFAGCKGDRVSVADAINAAPLAPYTKEVLDANGAGTTVKTCRMFAGTRAGYCLVSGSASAMRALVESSFSPDEIDGGPTANLTFGDSSCLVLDDFGTPTDTGAHAPRQGTHRYRAKKALPPNTSNISFRGLFVANGTLACFQYEFPYG